MSPVLGMGSSKGCTWWHTEVTELLKSKINTKQKPGLSCSSPDETKAGCHSRQGLSSVTILRSHRLGITSWVSHHIQVSDSASGWLADWGCSSLCAAATTEHLRLSDKQKSICLTELEARRPRWRGCIYSLILTKVYWATQRLQGVYVCVPVHELCGHIQASSQMWHVLTLATLVEVLLTERATLLN